MKREEMCYETCATRDTTNLLLLLILLLNQLTFYDEIWLNYSVRWYQNLKYYNVKLNAFVIHKHDRYAWNTSLVLHKKIRTSYFSNNAGEE